MPQTTARTLIDLTRHFYQTIAESFSQTRQTSWQGWQQLVPFFAGSEKNVLDVGCGNGRFGQFLAAETTTPFHYTGLDNNDTLLHKAAELLQGLPQLQSQFVKTDVLTQLIDSQPVYPSAVTAQQYSHIAIFGVLHHIPGAKNIEKFLTTTSQLLADNGYLLLSFWQPLTHPERFAAKQVPPAAFGIEASELTQNDLLLGWQTQAGIARFCHSFTDQEIEVLIEQLSPELQVVSKYQADGKSGDLNTYLVLQRQGAEKPSGKRSAELLTD